MRRSYMKCNVVLYDQTRFVHLAEHKWHLWSFLLFSHDKGHLNVYKQSD